MFPSISIFPSISMFQVRGALAEIILEAGDVVLLSSPVGRERETVTDLVMEVNTMGTLAVREI